MLNINVNVLHHLYTNKLILQIHTLAEKAITISKPVGQLEATGNTPPMMQLLALEQTQNHQSLLEVCVQPSYSQKV